MSIDVGGDGVCLFLIWGMVVVIWGCYVVRLRFGYLGVVVVWGEGCF